MSGSSSYFVLQSVSVPKRARVRATTELLTPPWLGGAILWERPQAPIEYEVRRGHGGALLPYYGLRYPLMRGDLVQALGECGVDNLEVFPAILVDQNTGTTHKNYHAVNVVGVIAASDPALSERSDMSDSDMIDASFESLAIDDTAAGGRLLFRLAESVNAIIAHARVKDFVEPRVPGIEFVAPSDWSG